MADSVNAEIVAIGTEILLGTITDTNSVYIAQQLKNVGINLYYMTTVGDNRERIATALKIALSRADVVITCGGLGPTVDDMTRQGVADAVGRGLTFQQDLFDEITARFQQYRVKMTDNNKRQAFLPDDAIAIPNPVGTAPSFIVEEGTKVIISLPGVPREMKYLMQETVIPYLQGRYALGIIKSRTLKTAGIGESSLDDLLGDDLLTGKNPTVGLAAHHGIIDIRITAKAATPDVADEMLEKHVRRVRERVGAFIFGEDDDKLEDVLIKLCLENNVRLGIIEAGVKQGIGQSLSKVSDSQVAVRLMALYDNPTDVRQFVEAETDLRDLAIQAARYAENQNDVSVGIAILSDPDVEESADADYATVVAVTYGDRVQSRVYGFGARSELATEWLGRWAMSIAWRMVKESTDDVD